MNELLQKNPNTHIYILNLPTRKDRKNLMIYKLNKIGIKKYSIFEAIDGNNNSYDKLWNSISSKNYFRTRGELGLVITYIELLIDAYNKNYDNIFIFEDDINFHKHFNKFVKSFETIIMGNNDIVWLGANQPCFDTKQIKSIENKSTYSPAVKYDIYNKTYGTYAVKLNTKAIDVLIDIINYRNIIKLYPVDLIINNLISQNKIKGIVCYPFLVMPDVTDSNIRSPRNQHIFCKSRKYIIDDYDYVSIKDFNIFRNQYH